MSRSHLIVFVLFQLHNWKFVEEGLENNQLSFILKRKHVGRSPSSITVCVCCYNTTWVHRVPVYLLVLSSLNTLEATCVSANV